MRQGKNAKYQITKDSKNTTNPRSSHPYTQRQLALERKTQDDLSSSQITYPEYFAKSGYLLRENGVMHFLLDLGDQRL